MGLRKVEATLLLCLAVDVNKSILKIAIVALFTIEIETSSPFANEIGHFGPFLRSVLFGNRNFVSDFCKKSVYWIKKEFDQISETLLQILLLD